MKSGRYRKWRNIFTIVSGSCSNRLVMMGKYQKIMVSVPGAKKSGIKEMLNYGEE